MLAYDKRDLQEEDEHSQITIGMSEHGFTRKKEKNNSLIFNMETYYLWMQKKHKLLSEIAYQI